MDLPPMSNIFIKSPVFSVTNFDENSQSDKRPVKEFNDLIFSLDMIGARVMQSVFLRPEYNIPLCFLSTNDETNGIEYTKLWYTLHEEDVVPRDIFHENFIWTLIGSGTIPDLNRFRIGPSTFEEYDANEILLKRRKWSDLKLLVNESTSEVEEEEDPQVRIPSIESSSTTADESSSPKQPRIGDHRSPLPNAQSEIHVDVSQQSSVSPVHVGTQSNTSAKLPPTTNEHISPSKSGPSRTSTLTTAAGADHQNRSPSSTSSTGTNNSVVHQSPSRSELNKALNMSTPTSKANNQKESHSSTGKDNSVEHQSPSRPGPSRALTLTAAADSQHRSPATSTIGNNVPGEHQSSSKSGPSRTVNISTPAASALNQSPPTSGTGSNDSGDQRSSSEAGPSRAVKTLPPEQNKPNGSSSSSTSASTVSVPQDRKDDRGITPFSTSESDSGSVRTNMTRRKAGPGRRTNRLPPFTRPEQQAMVDWVVRKRAFDRIGSRALYEEMREAKIANYDRTWGSLNNHFRKTILPNISQYRMSQEDRKKFIRRMRR